MEFTIKNIKLFKYKLKKLSKYITELSFEFKKSGITIYSMSPDNYIAVELSIPKKSIFFYKYKRCNSVVLSLYSLNKILSRFSDNQDNMKFIIIDDKIEISGKNGGIIKSFQIPIINLTCKDRFPKFKPNAKWELEGIIEGLSQISMLTNKGPLAIDSVNDDFPIRWIIATKR